MTQEEKAVLQTPPVSHTMTPEEQAIEPPSYRQQPPFVGSIDRLVTPSRAPAPEGE